MFSRIVSRIDQNCWEESMQKMLKHMKKIEKNRVFLHPDLTCDNVAKRQRGGSTSSRTQFPGEKIRPAAVFSSFEV